MKDGVAVIGAGTAGLIAAKKLAQLGIPTVVYDQKKVLGVPVRASGILSINGLDGLGIGYGRAITNTLYGARIHAGGETMKIEAKKAMAHVLDRKGLNDLCHDEAVANGADVILERRIGGQKLDLLAESNIIVGADGAVSEVAKHFSMGKIRKYTVTYKAEFNIASEDPRLVDLFFGKNISDGLFGWFSPNAKDILEVGIGVDSQSGNAKAAYERFTASPYVSGILGGAKPISEGASIIPMSLREKIVDEERRVMLVGDAAGQVKPSTGGGIVYGGNAAMMAAEAIHDHLSGKAPLGSYERKYNRKYGLDTWLHSAANAIYSGGVVLDLAIRAMNALGVPSFLSKYGDMDMPSLTFRNIFKAQDSYSY
jgi:flavin-dependent dehydrogenase